MLTGFGTIQYFDDEYKVNVLLGDDLIDFYRSLVPKSLATLNKPRFPGHITVVRNEEIPDMSAWNRYSNKCVEFVYDTHIVAGNVYWWLPVYCNELIILRQELGLPKSSQWTRPPDDSECFHITIGNTK